MLVAIFSDKFIDSIGEKILDKAKKAEKMAKQSNEKVDTIIIKDADIPKSILEPDKIYTETEKFEIPKIVIDKILKSLNSDKYKYRTTEGIAKDIGEGLSQIQLKFLLIKLEELGYIKAIVTTKGEMWTVA